jgi:succinate dehydrogenase/fumarate reductase flavoprotein subunit
VTDTTETRPWTLRCDEVAAGINGTDIWGNSLSVLVVFGARGLYAAEYASMTANSPSTQGKSNRQLDRRSSLSAER